MVDMPLIDLSAAVTAEADVVLEAFHRSTGKNKSDVVRDVLHRWALQEIRASSVLQSILQREGLSGASGGA